MKFKNISSIVLMLCIFTTIANAQLKVRNDEFIQIGYEDYRTLTFAWLSVKIESTKNIWAESHCFG